MSTSTKEGERKPRLRVELVTPRGSIHEADQSLSDSLVGLMRKSEGSKDKKDILETVEALLDTGTRTVMRVATSFMRSLRGRS